jgi:predicted metalloprotease with PDZ domain
MSGKLLSSLLLFVLSLSFLCRESTAQAKPATTPDKRVALTEAAPDIGFTVSMSKPSTHLLEVEIHLKWPAGRKVTDLKMPVWTPGSYLIREYARHVQDFKAVDVKGAPLKWEKINKNTWRISGEDLKEFVVTYRVYANELTVRTNELNDSHAFWNNAALLLYPANHLNAPSEVTVRPFEKWKVATGLPAVVGKTNTFKAENFDILYDSPFEVSNFVETTFTVRGVPHRIVMSGEGNYDLKQIAADTTKIAEEGIKMFGELPMENYLFIVNLRGGGGLEHLNSTALQFNRFGFKPRAPYMRFLNLVAHEYFHLWNVKRIRPDALGPFDYENENYTKLLWVAEGITAYYEGLLLERAGLITDQEFLGGKADLITDLQNRPGRFETSLEEASMDAWIKYYRPDENSINNQISYYDKGEIVGMMLDIEIRNRSAGKGSLDTVMKYLYDEFFKKGRNYTPEDFQKAAEKAAGVSLEGFFAKYVRGEAEIDYNAIVNGIGLELTRTEPNKGKAYIGADMTDDGGRLTVRTVPAGTPAYEQGLNTGDQIVAIDGYRASQAFLQTYLADKKPGNKVKFTLFRFDKLQDLNFTLGSNDRAVYEFEPLSSSSILQRRLYRDYLGGEAVTP